MNAHTTPTGTRLRAVAYRLLGSYGEADEAVREAEESGGAALAPLVRVCLTRLRAREAARTGPAPPPPGGAPGEEAVLEELPPAERVAFVLHDDFGVPFDEIAPAMDLTPAAARQLAARARRRVAETDEMPEPARP
ncbi:sigma factor-like helix-turn-helix DNA-binding protein [Streptomyces sp. NPDC057411]|uniref:sigma factor-like helix-turn-helix DNA-binding protein n=1 Tax=unclassified Streptomyces TaxID=2593676 RepID=UPI00363ECF7F